SESRGHQPGLFEQAHQGVLFFDEVADMPMGTQSKILRVLVEQSFARPTTGDVVRVDVRVLSASNRDLQAEIAAGTFREELYHRLNVVPITVPALDARREDIPELAQAFIQELNETQRLPLRPLSDEALAHLQTMTWPGNVRQLRNVLERCLIMGPDEGDIGASELPSDTVVREGEDVVAMIASAYAGMPLREAREVFEREYLIAQINRFGGNISRTASFVGMERSALHRKLKSLNIITTARSGARMASADMVEDEL
ncbi:MAG: sigma 54-interacting transcriptional regulator, partial [Pseudomonadota bacterium]